jgi:hypothetical protein
MLALFITKGPGTMRNISTFTVVPICSIIPSLI